MLHATSLILSLILFSAVVISLLIARPAITSTRGGKILAFVAMFCLPIFCGLLGVSREMARSKSTTFCLSCHTMEEYGKSLYVDDPTHLPASHFQNHRVPADEIALFLPYQLRDDFGNEMRSGFPILREQCLKQTKLLLWERCHFSGNTRRAAK